MRSRAADPIPTVASGHISAEIRYAGTSFSATLTHAKEAAKVNLEWQLMVSSIVDGCCTSWCSRQFEPMATFQALIDQDRVAFSKHVVRCVQRATVLLSKYLLDADCVSKTIFY
jgi:hypothetical protein